jgi:plasmid maintenance system antidote protein VapI
MLIYFYPQSVYNTHMKTKKIDITEIFSIATKHVLSTKGIKQNAIAKSLNIGTTTLNNYITGRREGDENTRRRIAERLGWKYEELLMLGQWILEGNPPEDFYLQSADLAKRAICESRTDSTIPQKEADTKEDRSDYIIHKSAFISVPKFLARLSGEYDSFQDTDRVESNLMFHKDFLSKHGSPDQMVLIEVTGNSMHPFLSNGDTVLVDLSRNTLADIVDGKAYAFREGQSVKIKRLSLQGSTLIASSESAQLYPPYSIDISNFSLIGEVLWVGHEVN